MRGTRLLLLLEVLFIDRELLSLERLDADHFRPLHSEHHEEKSSFLADCGPFQHLWKGESDAILKALANQSCNLSVLDVTTEVENLRSAHQDTLNAELEVYH